jgi:uroporphyrin-III C-methyltransferase/precorrin-2 dehydrogenase/sirohydrochlorin ferrochelatase
VIAETLINGGRDVDQPAAVIADGSLPSERVIRTSVGQLGKAIETQEVRPPAIMVMGDVARL